MSPARAPVPPLPRRSLYLWAPLEEEECEEEGGLAAGASPGSGAAGASTSGAGGSLAAELARLVTQSEGFAYFDADPGSGGKGKGSGKKRGRGKGDDDDSDDSGPG